ncbi:nucleotide exchange factor GrpE [bacterium]|nr:nucleotide exchange factor GrpE [bacterium]
MSQKPAPRINKIPFLVTDLVCLGAALGIIYWSRTPVGGTQTLAIVACVAVGAWVCVIPFLRDHDADLRFAEADRLADTVNQIGQMKTIASQIQGATAQWQTFQENAEKATTSMREMAGQLTTDAQNFAEAMKQSNDAEKAALRLEVEKRQRGEGEWLKILVGMLDHVHALYQAGVRSGQQNVIQQLTGFQAACRDLGRRVGLVAIEANPGEAFNPGTHRIPGEDQAVADGMTIAGTLATGFSFQGQLIRPVLVSLQENSNAPAAKVSEQSDAVEDAEAAEVDELSSLAGLNTADLEAEPDEPESESPAV